MELLMKRKAFCVLVCVCVLLGPSALASGAQRPSKSQNSCAKTYTVAMIKRAINATFQGTRNVTDAQRHRLNRYIRCRRNPRALEYVNRYRTRQRQLWAQRRNPPFYGPVLASSFSDSTTACGFVAANGFASRDGYCGQRLTFRHGGRTVVGVRDDYGPAGFTGREFDFRGDLVSALGCDGEIYASGSCSVYYR